MLRQYVRPSLGERVLVVMRPLDLQTTYHLITEHGLSDRTVCHMNVVLKAAMQQAVQWRLLLENPVDGVTVPQQPRNGMRVLTLEQVRTCSMLH